MSTLRRFDSSAFTLHEHCGAYAAEVGRCLKRTGLSDPSDFAALGSGSIRKDCVRAFETYRQCGSEFITTLDWSTSRCKREAEAFEQCSKFGGRDCEALELAVLRCSANRIKTRMSSGKPPPSLD
mmetsp:Transcript_51295/g.133236  ORF Transcript_51295/g.133236 Transcript_51295/m.133236 type:complete len:125 (-) Transcript_51295:246-620(-)|eukprot:CAMPEP_0115847802 /NCGR_PEP_ID=MMETSP0287-20121206/10576_1 /TAXON_ID=412157 /ORGANISM="Chrysochromulina rotalis, Strain UIO044" /LENGTH=124 /DNA_ID=CAMNT_0003301659 /DNA_START=94 /DNA_END=468 /DNA_ORIENTATION=+